MPRNEAVRRLMAIARKEADLAPSPADRLAIMRRWVRVIRQYERRDEDKRTRERFVAVVDEMKGRVVCV